MLAIAVTVWPTTVHIFMAYGYYTINGSSHREIEIDFEVEQALGSRHLLVH